MVLKILAQLMARHGATVVRSVTQAYRRVTAGSTAGARQQSPFHQFVDKAVKAVRHKPMTRKEAANILNINVPDEQEGEQEKKEQAEESEEEKLDAKLIMERFQKLMKNNDPSRGGSFYIQAKIYNAKEFFMKDFPPQMNESEFNPKEGDSTEKPEEPQMPPQLQQKEGEEGTTEQQEQKEKKKE